MTHLAAIDEPVRIGGPGKTVFVDETRLRNVIDPVKGARKQVRLLIFGDGKNFGIIPVAKGPFRSACARLESRIAHGSLLEIRDQETLAKLADHRTNDRLAGLAYQLSAFPGNDIFHELSVMSIALKQFILKSHTWISIEQLPFYLAHFKFLYRRRHHGERIFADAVSQFPSL